jgi:hypothetical protein
MKKTSPILKRCFNDYRAGDAPGFYEGQLYICSSFVEELLPEPPPFITVTLSSTPIQGSKAVKVAYRKDDVWGVMRWGYLIPMEDGESYIFGYIYWAIRDVLSEIFPAQSYHAVRVYVKIEKA